MPKSTVILDYSRCDPSKCEDGICAASKVCERKVLRQEAPGEMPDVYPNMCLGCSDCLNFCPTGALQKMQ